jgi:flagellar basal body rod protein FlgB
MIGNAGAMLVAENNAISTFSFSFSAPSPAEDNAMRAEKENENVLIATAKMEARLLESQQANSARMVESQQAASFLHADGNTISVDVE